jgi:glucokinase
VILAGDVGATKILLEVGELRSGRWQTVHSARLSAADIVSFPTALGDFLDGWERAKPARARLTAAAFGVAGPAEGNKVKMTHRPWAVDGDAIARRFRIPRVRVVNDLAAAAYGIEWLTAKEVAAIQPGRAQADEPVLVMGVGTGLGVAYLVPGVGGVRVVPGEGGHVGFSPVSREELALHRALHGRLGRVEAESVVSGTGLSNIHEALGNARLDAHEITQAAFERGDAAALATMELFSECLGNVAGDLVLATLARGGVYLAGGVMAKLAPRISLARFRSAFCAKGLFAGQLMRVPVRAVLTDHLPIYGAARCALERSL